MAPMFNQNRKYALYRAIAWVAGVAIGMIGFSGLERSDAKDALVGFDIGCVKEHGMTADCEVRGRSHRLDGDFSKAAAKFLALPVPKLSDPNEHKDGHIKAHQGVTQALQRPAAGMPTHTRAPHVQMQEVLGQFQQDPQRRIPRPFLQPDVPEDQQPPVEMRNLREGVAMDWADDDGYSDRLFNLYKGVMLICSLPISYVTFYNLPHELPNLLIAANLGSVTAMVPFVLRLRIGWGFISQRLLDHDTYYEANQRGNVAIKDEDVLLRDSMIQKYQVAPILDRINKSVVVLIAACFLSLGSASALTLLQGDAGPATLKTIRGDEAIRFEIQLRSDDSLAAQQQQLALRADNPRPGYCDSYYYRSRAGGDGHGGVGCGGQS